MYQEAKRLFHMLSWLVGLVPCLALAGCTDDERPPGAEPGAVVLDAWFHSGRQDKRRTIQSQIERFNASQEDVYIRANVIPEDTYNGQVQSAALAGDLPDVLEFDGPFLYNYVWSLQLCLARQSSSARGSSGGEDPE